MTSAEAIRQEREQIENANPIEAEIAARLNKIAQNLKAKPHESLATSTDLDRIAELKREARMPKLHAGRAELQGEEWRRTFEMIRGKLGTGFLFALIGTRGVGKTQMGCALISENATRLKPSRFVSAMDIFLDLKASFRKDAPTAERDIVEDYCKPRLLVIDEVQERAESPWEDRILTHLINRRYNDEKDTLIIGNITPETFRATMGNSIVSRLNETGGIISCEWESFRA